MKLNKKLFRNLAIGSFVTTVVAGLVMVASLLPVYSCVNESGFGDNSTSCPALDRASTIVNIGVVVIGISWTVFLISCGFYLYYYVRHKKTS